MSIRTGTRLLTVCAGIAGAGMVAAVPATAAEAPPSSISTPVATDLNTTGPLGSLTGSEAQDEGHPAGLPVGGGLLGGLPTTGLPTDGLPTGGLPLGG
ncbi:hypothetical protein RND61_12700 [Streptomyces sp. TRM76323]|uniref:ATP-binding protein n=1 Tax=Streptomyces tamarix TaxID=3078565 RepID=A0ABU3QKH3_9ACTN|nr:hypothetical protein [Streptomyces tamarix]MDT9682924.1 hypothetical protein [Streptomyces tamarix]